MKKILLFAVLALSLAAKGDVLLTTPLLRPNVLGGSGTISYDTIVIKSFTVDPQAGTVSVRIDLTVSSDPSRPAYQGTYTIVSGTGNPHSRLIIPTTGHDHSVNLGAGQVAAAQADIADFVTKVSTAMKAFGVADGTVQ